MPTHLVLGVPTVGTDPLLPWVDNWISRRCAVTLMCSVSRGPDWRKMRLRRFWTYYGHFARSSTQHPMQRLVGVCTVSNLHRGLRASWITDLPIRKLQKVYSHLVSEPERSVCPAWEVYAQDRKKWQALLPAWLAHWLPPDKEPRPSLEYLHDRQLRPVATS